MPAIVIDGKLIAEKIKQKIQETIGNNIKPKLGILCPNLPSSLLYMNAQVRLAASIGIRTDVVKCDEDSSEEYVETAIHDWNNDPDTHGIFILQPFIKGVNLERLMMLINPMKDVECIHPYDSTLRYFSKSPIGSCTALAIMEILDDIKVAISGTETVIVGHSKIVGRPVSKLLLDRNATVTVCNKATSDNNKLQEHVARAEILVVAIGKPAYIPGAWIKPRAVVIDVGVNHVNGNIIGDVEFESARQKASYITPARGGVGPVTAMIGMRQLVMAYELQHERR